MTWITPNRSRLMTGVTAFAAAGYLVFAIMSGNGGSGDSQKKWQEAAQNTIPFNNVRVISLTEQSQPYPEGVDPTVTNSIRNIADGAEGKPTPQPEQELTVLELIRKNADVAPGVSSGTDRVSVIVKSGDTLYGLSRRHGIGVEQLARLNGLQQPYTIKLGQTLYLAR